MTSVACKTSYTTPPSGQYVSGPVNVTVSQKGCDEGQVINSDVNFMEMTEVEYTHLQHLIQSHMESQDGADEVRLNPAESKTRESDDGCKACPSPCTSPSSQQDASSSSSLTPDVQVVSMSSNQGSEDGQEVKMLLYSDPSSISSLGESTPTGNGEAPNPVLVKMRCYMEAARERNNHRRALLFGSRPNPSARVCLEKRFNCDSCDLTQKQESQAAALNTFLSMLHNSTDIPGIAVHSEPEQWPSAEESTAEEGNRVGQGGKHPDGIVSENLSVNATADSVLRSPFIIYTDPANEEPVIDIENEVVQKSVTPTRLCGTSVMQAQDPNIMQGSGKWKPVCLMPHRKPGRRTRHPLEINQLKERHNLKERDRRRRIRLCCDELNMLVPFCYAETDRATTLQWTTAYLKYIGEIYGDSLKEGFQNTFCEETGVRVKSSCSLDVAKCEISPSKE